MTGPRGRILWVDDDGAERYLYEQLVLEAEGWVVQYALDVDRAAYLLSTESLDALFLDQMLPYSGLVKGDPIWCGCLLLRWLRGKGPPDGVQLDSRAALSVLQPLAGNVYVPVLVTSGGHDPMVEAAMRDASPMDRKIPLMSKPIDIEAMLEFLSALPPKA